MKNIVLYSAMSLDGKIAKENGDVEWLHDVPNPDKIDHGYNEFYESIDVTLMGNKTYQQVLGFDMPFPYSGKENYVFTNDENRKDDENVRFISKDIIQFVHDLKTGTGKDIWLVGGAAINTLLLNHNLIDRMMIFVMPVMLGSGIPLFSGTPDFSKLTLIESQAYSTGAVGLTYDIKKESIK